MIRERDEFFDAITARERRRLLTELVECEGTITLEAIDRTDGSDGRFVRLVHIHVPKLEEYGFVEWDRGDGSLSEGPAFDEIRPALRTLQENAEALPDGWP